MAVKKGYKQTDVGVIPIEWEVEAIGNAFEICNQHRLPLSQSVRERMKGPYPYYGPTSIQGWINEFRFDGKYVLIGEDGDHFLKWQSQAMTLLVDGQFNVNNHAHAIRGLKNLTDWFYWFFANRDITKHLTRQGAGRFKLTKATLVSLPIALPPTLAEQEAIAGALSDADAWIESLEQLIAKKRQIKQGAMQELLTGKRRLPGFAEPWCKKVLGELLKCHRLGGNYPNHEAETNYPLMKMGNVDRGEFNTNKIEYISNNIKPDQQDRLTRGDILLNTRNTLDLVGKVAIWRDELPLAYYNSNLLRLHFDSAIIGSHFFMNFALNSEDVIRQLRERATGTTSVAAIYTRDLLNVEIQLPSSRDEQVAIAEVIEDMDTEIDTLQTKLAKAHEVKQGMMQELLTGRIRLVPTSEERRNG